MDKKVFINSTKFNNRTYTQFTPDQVDRLTSGPSKIGPFPASDYPFYQGKVTSNTLGPVAPSRNQAGLLNRQIVNRTFDGVGGAAGILGAASIAAPFLAPAAAVAGVAYGTYKLGQTFDLW